MDTWLPTSCVLCAQNCGLLVQVDNNTIIKVKGDPANPRSQGYLCRKGANIAHYQHHAERLTVPLKNTERGFIEIRWEQAYKEIGDKLRSIVDSHGPRSLSFIGGGGQGSHFEAAFATSLLKGLGSRYHYTALAQELTGYFWCAGRMLGRQNKFPIPDEHHAEMLVAIGWNGMVSHQAPRAPLTLKEFAKNPDKLLVCIDPRKSETARTANIHLPLAPGTDALLARAMIAIILEKGWQDSDYLKQSTTGFDKIRRWFEDFDIAGALNVCKVEYNAVREICKEMTTRKWCMHTDLGVIMNRHSTLASYLYLVLAAVCGRLCVSGGNVIPGSVMPLGGHSDERRKKTWRTMETNFPEIMGYFPPNVFPEEVVSSHPDRLRAAIISSSNPLRSFADTHAWEKAFKELELSVTIEIAMTETAELSDYVLPARSAYESYDGSFFSWNFPEIYFQMRHPVVKPAGKTKESGLIIAEIAEAAGLLPDLPDYLLRSAKKDRMSFTAALLTFMQKNAKYRRLLPLIVAKVRKNHTESINLDTLWGLLLGSPKTFRKEAERAGYTMPSATQSAVDVKKLFKALAAAVSCNSPVPLAILTPKIGHSEKLFSTVMEHRSGLWLGKADTNNMKALATKDGKIHLYIEEMNEWMTEVTPEKERQALAPSQEYPFILNAGRHMPVNANNLMRNPEWNEGKRDCTLAMNPSDANALNLSDGETVQVSTSASSKRIELEISDDVRPGQVLIPHGFGLKYNGKTHGIAVNMLTKNTNRDRLAATPIHRHVPCKVEKVIER